MHDLYKCGSESAKEFKRFIFHEVSQFTELDLCGVPHHPSAVVTTGDQYCQEALHNHRTPMATPTKKAMDTFFRDGS